MKVPTRVYEIIVEMYNRHQNLARGTDAERRSLTMMMAEQVCYELGRDWGTKRADKGRPLGKDSISYFKDNVLMNYDWQNGSTRAPHSPPGNMERLDGQVFVPVNAVDHLGTATGDNPPVVIVEEKPYNEAYALEFGVACNRIYDLTHKPFDPGMIAVHTFRAAYDYHVGGMSWEESKRKHINDFRKEYGLLPL